MKVSFGLTVFLCGILLFTVSHLEAKPTNEKRSKTDNVSPKDHAEEKCAEEDMLMEPDELSHVSVVRSEGHQIYPSSTEYEGSDDFHSVTGHGLVDSHSQAAQNFYPQFFNPPPLGHSRPFTTLDGSLPINHGKFASSRSIDTSILGSGDFGVIRGGTFYSDEETPFHSDDDSEFNQFFGESAADSNNGHGRPQADAYVQKFTYPEEQFANFRDFADINTPSDSAYSQFVVVYANKNSTETENHSRPKNIFEQLELLDKEKTVEENKSKVSKIKAKLASTKLEKKYKKKLGPKDADYEPLLALS